MLERDIERLVCAFAKRNGWLCFKWTSPNYRGVPDRMFIRDGVVIFVEFKAPGKKPTKKQRHVMGLLEDEFMLVYVIDNVDAGKELFK